VSDDINMEGLQLLSQGLNVVSAERLARHQPGPAGLQIRGISVDNLGPSEPQLEITRVKYFDIIENPDDRIIERVLEESWGDKNLKINGYIENEPSHYKPQRRPSLLPLLLQVLPPR
jgi:hypothetical protein